MSYAVKELFRSIQGEGFHAGRASVFLRFAGCNLGYSVCSWCDTDWTGTDGTLGGVYPGADPLADAVASLWTSDESHRWCILTGGEPTLQVDRDLVWALQLRGFRVAIESNGTKPADPSLDWITVSPKQAASDLVQRSGDELKLPFPGIDPEAFEGMHFAHFFLQPIDPGDGEGLRRNTLSAIEYTLAHPAWRLSTQRQKAWGIR